ncbi:MAG: hypothetical protein ACXWJV_07445, partial [Hyphomicrobium sp.]
CRPVRRLNGDYQHPVHGRALASELRHRHLSAINPEVEAMKSIRGVVMPWFRREDYARIREIMEGGDKWLSDYDAWQARAEKQIKDVEAQGMAVERVYLDPDEFLAWCEKGSHHPDSMARQRYAAEFGAGKFKNQA